MDTTVVMNNHEQRQDFQNLNSHCCASYMQLSTVQVGIYLTLLATLGMDAAPVQAEPLFLICAATASVYLYQDGKEVSNEK
jgi:hypothetical protein